MCQVRCPQALRTRLIGCRIVMPLYDDIPQEMKDNMQFITSLSGAGGLAAAVLRCFPGQI